MHPESRLCLEWVTVPLCYSGVAARDENPPVLVYHAVSAVAAAALGPDSNQRASSFSGILSGRAFRGTRIRLTFARRSQSAEHSS